MYLLKGTISSQLFKLGTPLFINLIVVTVISLINHGIYISRLGVNELAAVAFFLPVTAAIVQFLMGLCQRLMILAHLKKGERTVGRSASRRRHNRINQERMGVTYTLSGVYYLMKDIAMRWISMGSKHPKQDEKAQKQFKKTLRL